MKWGGEEEESIKLVNTDLSVRDGQRVSMIYGGPDPKTTSRTVFINHDARKWWGILNPAWLARYKIYGTDYGVGHGFNVGLYIIFVVLALPTVAFFSIGTLLETADIMNEQNVAQTVRWLFAGCFVGAFVLLGFCPKNKEPKEHIDEAAELIVAQVEKMRNALFSAEQRAAKEG